MSNLLTFLDKITKNIDCGTVVDAVFLDFAKAFDKVAHKTLILKLKSHGIDGRLIAWIIAVSYTHLTLPTNREV